jgi:hypothetical protein
MQTLLLFCLLIAAVVLIVGSETAPKRIVYELSTNDALHQRSFDPERETQFYTFSVLIYNRNERNDLKRSRTRAFFPEAPFVEIDLQHLPQLEDIQFVFKNKNDSTIPQNLELSWDAIEGDFTVKALLVRRQIEFKFQNEDVEQEALTDFDSVRKNGGRMYVCLHATSSTRLGETQKFILTPNVDSWAPDNCDALDCPFYACQGDTCYVGRTKLSSDDFVIDKEDPTSRICFPTIADTIVMREPHQNETPIHYSAILWLVTAPTLLLSKLFDFFAPLDAWGHLITSESISDVVSLILTLAFVPAMFRYTGMVRQKFKRTVPSSPQTNEESSCDSDASFAETEHREQTPPPPSTGVGKPFFEDGIPSSHGRATASSPKTTQQRFDEDFEGFAVR